MSKATCTILHTYVEKFTNDVWGTLTMSCIVHEQYMKLCVQNSSMLCRHIHDEMPCTRTRVASNPVGMLIEKNVIKSKQCLEGARRTLWSEHWCDSYEKNATDYKSPKFCDRCD